MFSIGLEFSFRKLMNSGASAMVTALIVILGMTFAGFGVGYVLGLHQNCLVVELSAQFRDKRWKHVHSHHKPDYEEKKQFAD